MEDQAKDLKDAEELEKFAIQLYDLHERALADEHMTHPLPWHVADIATKIPIPIWALFGCGLLMATGMFTTYAQRVTRAEINTGSQFDRVALYAPAWCQWLARCLLSFRRKGSDVAPPPARTRRGKKLHYDAVRASVIMSVSASVIALASSRGLPVSTTYDELKSIIQKTITNHS